MATVTKADGSQRQVKNLGWLVRNALFIDRILIEPDPAESTGCILTASLGRGAETYRVVFASRRVCWDWLRSRRSLVGVWVRWNDRLRCSCDNLPDTMIPLT